MPCIVASVSAMLEVGCKAGINEAWANARSANLGFYRRSGFRAVSSEFEIPKIGPHVVMACVISEKVRKAHLGPKGADVGADAPEPEAD